MKFKADEVGEIVGMDEDQCGEFAYDFVHKTCVPLLPLSMASSDALA